MEASTSGAAEPTGETSILICMSSVSDGGSSSVWCSQVISWSIRYSPVFTTPSAPTRSRVTALEDNYGRFLSAFFFSAHTLTTVGYGNLAPNGTASNVVASLEAMVGLMGFAVATGLLFGRISRPSARIGFSTQMLIAPYQNGTSLQFRIVNLRPNMLMELEASVLLMTVDGPSGALARSYNRLTLERDRVYYLPLTWTIVHPIDANSPLYGKTAADLERLQAEFLILIKGYDDTFSQTVHARSSYRYDEVTWNARFTSAFHIDAGGDVVLDVDEVSTHTRLSS